MKQQRRRPCQTTRTNERAKQTLQNRERMDHLHHTSVINNMGVTLLESNNTLGAIHAFQQAVMALKTFTDLLTLQDIIISVPNSICIPSSTTRSTKSSLSSSTSSVSPSSSSSSSSSLTSFLTLRAGTQLDGLSHGNYYVYNRSLRLPCNLSTTISDDLDMNMLKTSAILIFNFALSCHQCGNQYSHSAALQQAVQLYELTFKMIHQVHMKDRFFLVLMWITMNNLANLHHDLCNYDHCTQCIKWIHHLFTCVSNIDMIALEYLHENEWTDLKLNILVMEPPTAAQAA